MSTSRIYKVTSVRARLLRGPEPALVITADGTTLTNGWKNPKLRKLSDKGGTYELEYIADEGTGAEGTFEVQGVSFIFFSIPLGIRKVIVKGQQNQMELSWTDAELAAQITAARATGGPRKLARAFSATSIDDAFIKAVASFRPNTTGEPRDYVYAKMVDSGRDMGQIMNGNGNFYVQVEDLTMSVFKFSEQMVTT